MEYIISVGTNMGDRKENIDRAIESINLLPYTDVIRQSSVYETEPVGYARQQNFYNIALVVESVFEPGEMLGACLGIESGFGRLRTVRNGPRIIDLDIIFAEDAEINSRNLIVPHPRYHERRFVLEPLLELFPDGTAYGIEFKHYLDEIDGQEIIKL
ncbi:MAG: 2-amino-4-hydroxy-6-hydroxymethyldihydropteridine diphosphokinase [Eubacteriales bacterium]|nr:2-amino-4-hydroxy-6-hydroxymethyldihydropteridine diphosphokinase [Eubacteriales bacterium]